ncbi:hypothetical protein HYE67_006562 [Fusarium culmorum]|uniref:Secreted protein CSS2 C-terminal domain-containing protein n=1 Tax=Fusarium culmorum TaxID=5516 RepID=A0A2T4H389_FUSCU|nr:hypothetical protein FCULG_00007566 [Fusarium culmorum]QPC64331.1 hypothetical protein HYE67_006562 [Fusarium culmorum]
MVIPSKALFTGIAFSLIGPGSALYDEPNQRVGYNPLVTEWNGPDSNLTATIGLVDASYVSHFDTRRQIDVTAWAGVVGAGGTVVIAANSAVGIYSFIADLIKSKANSNSCSMTTGTDSDGHYVEGYAYQATTSGHDCKTTSERKTILAAVKKCADWLHSHGAINGCCKFSHGGTWTGHLRLTSQPSKYPAHSVTC